MQARTTSDVDVRIGQAFRLDQSLYTNIATRGVGGRQALKIILITAVFFGTLECTASDPAITQAYSAGYMAPEAIAQIAVVVAGVPIAHVTAWLIWTSLLCLVGNRCASPNREPPSFGSVARALAFAQSPILVAPVIYLASYIIATVLATLPDGSLSDLSELLTVTQGWAAGLVNAWILAGTFLAMRTVLGLSGARTLLALLSVSLLIAVLFGTAVVLLSVAAGREAVGLYAEFPPGFKSAALSAEDIAYRLDFNFGFLGFTDGLLYYLSRSILHPLAAAGAA